MIISGMNKNEKPNKQKKYNPLSSLALKKEQIKTDIEIRTERKAI